MDYFLIVLIVLGTILLVYKWIEYLKATRGTDGFAKRKVVSYLFLGFVTLVGITTIFAEAIFEFLGLEKPAQFEWMSFGAFLVLTVGAVLIMRFNDKSNRLNFVQKNYGSGTIIGRDQKITYNYYNENKVEIDVTELISELEKGNILNAISLLLTVSRDKNMPVLTKNLIELRGEIINLKSNNEKELNEFNMKWLRILKYKNINSDKSSEVNDVIHAIEILINEIKNQ